MSNTPRGAPELVSAQAAPETTVNEQIRRTEAGAGRFAVADRVTAPPGTCADGACYIIIATATGAFTGKENQIATAVGTNAASGWYYRTLGTIDEGIVAYVQDEDTEYKWSGSAWAVYTGSGVGSTASTTEQLTGTDTAKASTPDSVAALWEQGSDVASAGTISLGEGGYFNITGTTTITDIDFATDKAGRKAWVKFAGALTLTHSGTTLILPTGANITTAAGDTACFISEGSDVVRCVAYQRASGYALNDATGGGGSGSGIPIVTGNPSTFAVKGTTAGTPGTGNFTPNAASSGFKAWSTVFTGWTGVVRFEDGSDWEHSFCYWNGTALTRSANQFYESSSGSALSLTSSATATLLMNIDTFLSISFAGPTRGTTMAPANNNVYDSGAAWTNITSPSAPTMAATNLLTEQPRLTFTSATTANAATGRSPSQPYVYANSTAGRGGGLMSYKFGFTQFPTSPRCMIGGAGTNTVSTATEPSALVTNMVVVGFDSTDTNMQFITNNNSGSGTKTDTGIARAIDTWYQYAMWVLPGSLEWHQMLIDHTNGTIYYRKTSTDCPATGAGLQPHIVAQLTASTGTAIVLQLGEVLLKMGRV